MLWETGYFYRFSIYRSFSLDIHVSAKTHIGRSSGARDAEHNGASLLAIQRHGGWGVTALTGAYLAKSLPLEALRTLAGFPPRSGSYYLPRASATPPEELQRTIFPFLEKSKEQLSSCSKKYGSEIAGKSFMELMLYLRIVILQDVAVLSTLVLLSTLNIS